EAGFVDLAKALDLAIRSLQFSERLEKNAPKSCLHTQTKKSMPEYMNLVVRGCDRNGWPMRRVFLGHLSRVVANAAVGEADGSAPSEALTEFGKAGGWKYVISWLSEEPQVSTWPAFSTLDELGVSLSSQTPYKLFAVLHKVLTTPGFEGSKPASCLPRLERHLTRAVAIA
ncbi:LTA4H, partial [Symbiodinium pilosum]